MLAASLAHGPLWWVGPLALLLIAFGPPLAVVIVSAIRNR